MKKHFLILLRISSAFIIYTEGNNADKLLPFGHQ